MSQFSDMVWASVFGGKTPYDPNNTLFTKSDEIAKERRYEAARARESDRNFQNQMALEDMRQKNALEIEKIREDASAKRRKDEMDYQAKIFTQAREDADVNKRVLDIEERNRARDALYANADAAMRHVGFDAGFKINPKLDADQNENAARLAISRANAMAYRYHENQAKEDQDKLRELQDKLFEAQTPTDAEVGPNISVIGMPKSISASVERQNLLRAGKIDKAIAGLPAADQGQLLSEVARVREEMAAAKAKAMAPQIRALTMQITAMTSRNAESAQVGKDMRDGISNGKPIWMMVPAEVFRGKRSAVGAGGPVEDLGDRDAHLSMPAPTASVFPSPTPTPAATPSATPGRDVAIAAGLSALGVDPSTMGGPDDSIGQAFARGLQAQADAGLPLHDQSFLGIPIRDNPANVTDLTPAIRAVAAGIPQAVGSGVSAVSSALTPENIRARLDAIAAPVRDAGHAVGAFLNPALRPPATNPPPVAIANPLMDRIPRIQLPSTGSFVPFLPPTQNQTPASIVSDYLRLREKYGDIALPSGNAFPFAR